MRLGAVNKIRWLFLVCFCFSAVACAQTEVDKHRLAIEHEKKAYELRERGDFQKAVEEQLKSIELNPNGKSFVILSGIYQEQKNWQEAIEAARKAVELIPKDADAHYALADALRELGNYQEALKSFQESIRLSPNDTNALINLGGTYEELKDKESARKYYEKALEIDSSYIPAVYLLGELEAEDGN